MFYPLLFSVFQHITLSTYLYSPFPTFIFSISNRITTKSKSATIQVALFLFSGEASKARFRKRRRGTKRRNLRQQRPLLLRSLMARGGEGCAPAGSKSHIIFTTWTTFGQHIDDFAANFLFVGTVNYSKFSKSW